MKKNGSIGRTTFEMGVKITAKCGLQKNEKLGKVLIKSVILLLRNDIYYGSISHMLLDRIKTHMTWRNLHN